MSIRIRIRQWSRDVSFREIFSPWMREHFWLRVLLLIFSRDVEVLRKDKTCSSLVSKTGKEEV